MNTHSQENMPLPNRPEAEENEYPFIDREYLTGYCLL